MGEPETAAQLRSLLERLESSEAAVDILQDLAEIAKETQVAIDRARREGPRPTGSDASA